MVSAGGYGLALGACILEARELSSRVRLEGRTFQEVFCRPSYADGQPMHTAGCALRAGEADAAAARNHQITTRTLLNERSTPMRRARLAWSGRDGPSRRRTAGRGGRAAYLAAREPPRCPYWTCRWSRGHGFGRAAAARGVAAAAKALQSVRSQSVASKPLASVICLISYSLV